VLNFSFYAFHIRTIVAIPGNWQPATSTSGTVLHSCLHKPQAVSKVHLNVRHPQGIQRDHFVRSHHRFPAAAATAVAANVHEFARILGTRHVHADLKEAAMVNLLAPMPDERQWFCH
jgi:hypothetical protein